MYLFEDLASEGLASVLTKVLEDALDNATAIHVLAQRDHVALHCHKEEVKVFRRHCLQYPLNHMVSVGVVHHPHQILSNYTHNF